MNILQKIFIEHYEEIIYTLNPRRSVIENIDKMIRYGSLYTRHINIDKKLIHAISRVKRHIFRNFKRWRIAILSAFGYDPLECKCGSKMVFLVLRFNHKHVSLEEMYEKAMSRSRGWRSTG